MRNQIVLLFIILLQTTTLTWAAADLAREQRLAEEISDAVVVGDPVWLVAGEQKFLGIYTEPDTDERRGAVILLHGMGVHPDWPEVINPLRSTLPEHGWATLSIQLPVLGKEARVSDYLPLLDTVGPRVEAAVDYLEGQGFNDIALVGHSLGALMGADYLAGGGRSNIKAFVAIGLVGGERSLQALEKIRLPLLDLYGAHDLDSVLHSRRARQGAARKAGNTDYVQREIAGADHFFSGHDHTLVATVRSWLARVMAEEKK